ncbi:MAG: MarR family transcriptional regulator [Flavobacteriaceae bacterium]|nr:MarR family transcriptional regulator [Flavobacteriaceae bacterium]|tara:strand:+ start:280 stop:711 length:432 start_codon:yes stop_codon:yes gene_type:complete
MKTTTIDYTLRTTWHAVKKMYDEGAKKYGYTMSIGFTLLSIDPVLGTSSTSLGPKMGMEANSLSRILKSMETKKLIKRKPNPDDGRGVLIFLTGKGRKKRDVTKEKVFRFNSLLNRKIGKEKIKSFHKISDMIKDIIPKEEIF